MYSIKEIREITKKGIQVNDILYFTKLVNEYIVKAAEKGKSYCFISDNEFFTPGVIELLEKEGYNVKFREGTQEIYYCSPSGYRISW
jgi:hypothetical protein